MNENQPGYSSPDADELEQTREAFLTKPIEQARIATSEETDLPQGTFGTHEGMIAYVDKDRGSTVLTADTDEMRSRLEGEGYYNRGGAVPFTGAQSGTEKATKIRNEFAANLAAIDRGLSRPDWDNLTDEQERQLGYLGVDHVVGSEFGSADQVMIVSHADQDNMDPYSADGQERLKSIGEYYEAVMPIPHNSKEGIAAYAITDAEGNQVLVLKSELMTEYLEACGYENVSGDADRLIDPLKPFGVEFDEILKDNSNAYQVARTAVSRLQMSSEPAYRGAKTTLVDLAA